MQINQGIEKKINRIKKAPEAKSIQLAKLFKSPRRDLTKKIAAKKIKISVGSENPEINIKNNPPIKSTAPRILTSIFFKSNIYI